MRIQIPLDRFVLAAILLTFSIAAYSVESGETPDTKPSQLSESKPDNIRIASRNRTSKTAENTLEQAFKQRKKLTRTNLNNAIQLFIKSSKQFLASGDPQKAALAQLEAGDTYQMMSRYQLAFAAYGQALRISPKLPETRCAALSRMARTYANIGRINEAQQYSDGAVATCEPLGDKKAFADALEAQGEVRFWSTNMSDAVTLFTRAQQLASEVNDHDGEALSTMMLAQAINASDREQSYQLAWKALKLWNDNQNDYGAARAHMVLAFFGGGAGNFGVAECHCRKALPIFQHLTDKDNEAIAENILGIVTRQAGDAEASLDYYGEARRAFAAAQDDLGEAESITGMADVLTSQHQYEALLPLYTRKLHLAQKTKNRVLLASALVDIAGVYVNQHQYENAESNYQQGLKEYRAAENRYGESITLMRLANLRIAQGELLQAIDLLDQAQELKEQTGEIEDIARIQYLRAQIYFKNNQLEQARAEIEKTIATIESQRLRISKFDTRAQYFASVHEYYSLYIQTLVTLHRIHPEQKFDQLAFEAAERSKVRALLDRLENSESTTTQCDQSIPSNNDPYSAKSNERTTSLPDPSSAHALTLAQIQAEIGDTNTVLLEYALGNDQSFAWLIHKDKIETYDLASAARIRDSVRAFREAFLLMEERENETSIVDYLKRRSIAKRILISRSKELANLLLGSLDLPPGKRLLIVPDGPLQYVPFAALPVPSKDKGTTPLVEQAELAILPSASVLAALRKTAANRPPPTNGIAIFADPVFEKAKTTASINATVSVVYQRSHELRSALVDSGKPQHIPSLPGSRTEAFAIQEIVGATQTRLALGLDANRASVIDGSLAHQRLIHFATHGIVDTRRPEMSGLILSLLNKRGQYQDGYLRLSDIYNLKLSADLVVLSSCESALGKDLESEGTIGLPRGFLYAGARSVIASLWKVDDDATAILMKGLYSRMQRGETPAGALRGAQLDLFKSKQFSDPYYWAAFVLEGDYR